VHRTFTHFLARSLTLFEDEQPRIYAEIAARVGIREVRCDVDGDLITIRGDGSRLHLTRAVDAPAVRIRTSREVILALIDAETTLQDALWDDRILLKGLLPDLLAFHDGLMAFLHGAVRCPSFPDLLQEYLGASPDRRTVMVVVDSESASAPAEPCAQGLRRGAA
jgi:hypothetical protein